MTESLSSPVRGDLIERYEQLRAHVLCGTSRGGHPLEEALLRQQGMAAWIHAWSTRWTQSCARSVPPTARVARHETADLLPFSVHAQAARILAIMALRSPATL